MKGRKRGAFSDLSIAIIVQEGISRRMSRTSNASTRKFYVAALTVAAFALLLSAKPMNLRAQSNGQAASGSVARGKYIVVGVAHCGDCHTPKLSNGEPDYSRWLAGAPVPYLPARPSDDWPILAPRLAGAPPATDQQMVTLLTTGIWINGKPLRTPMPRFQMTTEDAQAVLAYLKSLTPGHDSPK